MIEARELRAGNYLQGKPTSIPRMGIHGDGITKITAYGVYAIEAGMMGDMLPIRLTPEILKMCGFEKQGENEDYNMGVLRVVKCWDNKYRVVTNMFDLLEDEPECTYLHQLQNVFYFIMREELNYTP